MRFEQALKELRGGKTMTYGEGNPIYFIKEGKMYFSDGKMALPVGQLFASAIFAEDWRPQFLGNKEVLY